ncbi:hypothetical protein IWX50DRAFT_90731 [Phyllosticta citricarpa]
MQSAAASHISALQPRKACLCCRLGRAHAALTIPTLSSLTRLSQVDQRCRAGNETCHPPCACLTCVTARRSGLQEAPFLAVANNVVGVVGQTFAARPPKSHHLDTLPEAFAANRLLETREETKKAPTRHLRHQLIHLISSKPLAPRFKKLFHSGPLFAPARRPCVDQRWQRSWVWRPGSVLDYTHSFTKPRNTVPCPGRCTVVVSLQQTDRRPNNRIPVRIMFNHAELGQAPTPSRPTWRPVVRCNWNRG